MESDEYLDLHVGAFLERLGTGHPAPGSGSASALTVAFAAAIVAKVARRSADTWEDAGGVAAQALALQARAAPLAVADARVWEEALTALDSVTDGEPPPGALERKLGLAAEVPLQIAETAADAAALAALAADRGIGHYKADAAAAAVLAAAGAKAAAHLVAVNLAVREGDPQSVRARASESAAAESAAQATKAGR